jgi:hypothetical protein
MVSTKTGLSFEGGGTGSRKGNVRLGSVLKNLIY